MRIPKADFDVILEYLEESKGIKCAPKGHLYVCQANMEEYDSIPDLAFGFTGGD